MVIVAVNIENCWQEAGQWTIQGESLNIAPPLQLSQSLHWQFPPPEQNLASLAMSVQRNTRNLRFVTGVNSQLQACLRTLNAL